MSPTPSAPLVLLAGWLVPGGGHYLLGRRTQGLVFFLAITLTFLGGMALADFTNVSAERHGYYFLAHILNGGETLLALFFTSGIVETHVPLHFGIPTAEIGMLYTSVAAILNLIVMMNAYGVVLDRRAPAGAPTPGPAEEDRP